LNDDDWRETEGVEKIAKLWQWLAEEFEDFSG
jgi:hypothetical protein